MLQCPVFLDTPGLIRTINTMGCHLYMPKYSNKSWIEPIEVCVLTAVHAHPKYSNHTCQSIELDDSFHERVALQTSTSTMPQVATALL